MLQIYWMNILPQVAIATWTNFSGHSMEQLTSVQGEQFTSIILARHLGETASLVAE